MNDKLIQIVLIVIFLTSCNLGKTSNSKLSHREGTSIDSFSKWVNFPYDIKAVKWEIELKNNAGGRISGPGDELIYADIECNRESIKSLEDSALKNKFVEQNDIYLDLGFLKDWYSDSVKYIFYKKDNYLRIRNKAYKTDRRFLSGGIFSQGWFTIVGTDRIFLYVWTS